MSEMITMGTCSLCGGAVKTPRLWSSVEPAPIVCSRCGAHAASHGPVIGMRPQSRRQCSGPCFCTGACRTDTSNGTMFIGPGLVPYEAEGMTQLDPESAQLLADNLWDMYQES